MKLPSQYLNDAFDPQKLKDARALRELGRQLDDMHGTGTEDSVSLAGLQASVSGLRTRLTTAEAALDAVEAELDTLGWSCMVKNSAAISLTTATWTLVTFDTDVSDAQDMHSTTTNTSRITIPTGGGGKVRVQASLSFASNATGMRQALFKVNADGNIASGTTVGADFRPALSGDRTVFGVGAEFIVSDGDRVELFVRQDSGGALNLEANTDYSPRLSLSRVP